MKVILIKLGIFLFSLVFIAAGAAAILKFMGDDTQTKVALIAFVLAWVILTLVLLTMKIGSDEKARETPDAPAGRAWVAKYAPALLMFVLIVMAFFSLGWKEGILSILLAAGSILLAGAWSRDTKGKGSDSK